MTGHWALVGRWYADPAAAADRELREIVLPALRGRPGLVAGYWTRDPESGRTHATIVFDSEAAARAFKSTLDTLRRPAAALGVAEDYLLVTGVVAEAYPVIVH